MAAAGESRAFPVLIIPPTILLLLLLLLFTTPCFSLAANMSLNQGGPALNSSSTLVSPNGIFTLGFQRLGSGQSSGSYLTIWYTSNNASSHWTANRDSPIPNDGSGALVLNQNGALQLTYSDGVVAVELYSNSQQRRRRGLTAVLEDTGNFVVRDDSAGQLLWQSFDSPTNAWLPGMKLGVVVNRQNSSRLTSWLATSVPLSGTFTLEWDPTAGKEELVMKRRGEVHWTSGKLLAPDRFQNLDLRNSDSDVSVSRVSNLDEDYLTLTYQREFTYLRLSSRGLIFYVWPLLSADAIGGDCDGKGTEKGCLRWQGPECRQSNGGDRFARLQGASDKLEWWRGSFGNQSTADCKDMCWRDCECGGTADSFSGLGCSFFRSGDFKEGGSASFHNVIVGAVREANNTTTDAYAPTHSPAAARSRNMWIWIAVAAAGALFILILCILWYQRRRKSRETLPTELMMANEGNQGHDRLVFYSVASIMTATDDFALQNKLGQGGFGPVYKGKLSDGQEVAVKRLSKTSGQGSVEFKNELILIAKLQHRNLVRLLGCCIHGEEKMLVYEFMPNKSLDSFLFDESKKFLLGWNKRFNIIEGIAQGLLYLHKFSRVRIVHRDLKAGNILLNENMKPKISDFGMARIFDTSALAANTNRPVGTYGYMSPEYAMNGNFSTKSDVFSFGVMLLEIVSGRKNYTLIQLDHPVNLVGYAWKLWKEGTPLQLMDPSLGDSCSCKDQEQVLRCITVGLICMEYDPQDRPEISDVLSMLTSEMAQLPSPKQPACTITRPRRVSTESSTTSNSRIYSNNEVTITTMSPR